MAVESIAPKTVVIYALLDPTEGEIRYVGKTRGNLRTRFNGHLSDVRRGRVFIPRHKWISGLLSRGIVPAIVEIDRCEEGKWQEAEKRWILHFREVGCRLLNATDGGDGLSSYRHRADTREKQRAAALRRYESAEARKITGLSVSKAFERPEVKANLRKAAAKRDHPYPTALVAAAKSEGERKRKSLMAARRKFSPEAIEKIRAAAKGRKMSAAFCAKQSARLTGGKHRAETIAKMRETWARKKAEKVA